MTLVTIDEAARELNVPRASFSPHPRRTFAPDSPRLRDAMVSMGELVRIEGGLPASPEELAAYLPSVRSPPASRPSAWRPLSFFHKAKGEQTLVTDDVLEVLRGLAAGVLRHASQAS